MQPYFKKMILWEQVNRVSSKPKARKKSPHFQGKSDSYLYMHILRNTAVWEISGFGAPFVQITAKFGAINADCLTTQTGQF